MDKGTMRRVRSSQKKLAEYYEKNHPEAGKPVFTENGMQFGFYPPQETIDNFVARLMQAGFTNISHGMSYAPANCWNANDYRFHVRATAPDDSYFTQTQLHLHKNRRVYYTWYGGRFRSQYHSRLPK